MGEILPQLQSPKLIVQYAKAREVEGRYRDALAAYRSAHDYTDVVRCARRTVLCS